MSDPLAQALDAEDVEKEALRQQVRDLERRVLSHGDLAGQLKSEKDRSERLQRELDILSYGSEGRTGPPKWISEATKTKKGAYRATPWLLLSDLHMDEVVDPAQVLGINKYDRDIALQRLQRLGDGFVQVARDHWAGIEYDGIVAAMLGDNFPGLIHQELTETNADTVLGSLEFWLDPMGSLLEMLADEFGKVHVPVVVGNHGRLSRKPVAKGRARNNLDWKFGMDLQRMFRNDKRLTFDVSDSPDVTVPCYGRTVMLNHGEVSGGKGIGGIWPPIMRLYAQKRARQDAVKQPFDLLCIGHHHQLVFGPDFVVNGSMVGYDEYAFTENFGYQVPQQAAFLMTPEHGKTWTAPVFCQDREAEGW